MNMLGLLRLPSEGLENPHSHRLGLLPLLFAELSAALSAAPTRLCSAPRSVLAGLLLRLRLTRVRSI